MCENMSLTPQNPYRHKYTSIRLQPMYSYGEAVRWEGETGKSLRAQAQIAW